MKKSICVFVFVMACLLLVSCGISKDKAVDIAIESIGTSKVYVQKWEVEEDKENGLYKVTTWKDGKYVISVDSKTGKIVESEFTPEV
jgi:uncharacterized membrane protein YkoI